jgi:cobyrinic acid a,c-diamide synthase
MKSLHTYRILVIAGTGSGTGKTSITSGLIFNLRKKGFRVQPFKVGPDFLDPSWLSVAAQRDCVNLDSWMTSKEYVKSLVQQKMENADIGIIEGAMGLYDGANANGIEGSTAEIARLLNVPVILIANAHGASRSFAATINGFVNFPDAPDFAGIIANHCGSERHKEILSEALVGIKLPPLLGTIPRNSLSQLPSRHLGLTSASTEISSEQTISQIASICELNLEIEKIIQSLPIFTKKNEIEIDTARYNAKLVGKPIRIAYALDKAFHFYYSDNLDLLTQNGAELVSFSPLFDPTLPKSIDGLYLGGGYPEMHASYLSKNASMIKSVQSFAISGKPIYAECGGLMYLSRSIKDLDAQYWPMAGILPCETAMNTKLQTLGYCEVKLKENCIIGKKDMKFKGHEFHYSSITDTTEEKNENGYEISYRSGRSNVGGYINKNILASYVHLHWGQTPEAAESFIQSCRSQSNDNS